MTAPAPPLRMPAEWEPHRATWIAWPHHEPDWPEKLETIPWVYTEITRLLARHERVEILCVAEASKETARHCLHAHAVNAITRVHAVRATSHLPRRAASSPQAENDRRGDVIV